MRRIDVLTVPLLALVVGGCATGRFRQVSYAGEAAQMAEDPARITVHVVKNTEMKDTLKYFGKGTHETLLMDVREKERAWH